MGDPGPGSGGEDWRHRSSRKSDEQRAQIETMLAYCLDQLGGEVTIPMGVLNIQRKVIAEIIPTGIAGAMKIRPLA